MNAHDLEALVADLDAQIRSEEGRLLDEMRQSHERLATLVLRRRRVAEMQSELLGGQVEGLAPRSAAEPARADSIPTVLMAELRRVHEQGGINGGHLKRAVAAESGKATDSIAKAMTRLKSIGLIERTEQGVWRLTAEGLQRVEQGEAVED